MNTTMDTKDARYVQQQFKQKQIQDTSHAVEVTEKQIGDLRCKLRDPGTGLSTLPRIQQGILQQERTLDGLQRQLQRLRDEAQALSGDTSVCGCRH